MCPLPRKLEVFEAKSTEIEIFYVYLTDISKTFGGEAGVFKGGKLPPCR